MVSENINRLLIAFGNACLEMGKAYKPNNADELNAATQATTDTAGALRNAISRAETADARIAEFEAEIDIRKDQLREAKNILIDKNLQIDSLYEEGYKLQQRIAELEEKQRWRVVADGELPEVYRDEDGEFIPFLVCEGDGDRPFIAMYGGINWHAGIFVPDITHWMPLPELPEVQE